jgi:hypothetical protein
VAGQGHGWETLRDYTVEWRRGEATRGEGMTGTWKEEGEAAVITWNTGWTTKIAKQGNQYHKAAYSKGQSLDAAPANSSDAQKVK